MSFPRTGRRRRKGKGCKHVVSVRASPRTTEKDQEGQCLLSALAIGRSIGNINDSVDNPTAHNGMKGKTRQRNHYIGRTVRVYGDERRKQAVLRAK